MRGKESLEFEDDKVTEQKCSVKEQSSDIREAPRTFLRKNTSAKPSHFPYQHLARNAKGKKGGTRCLHGSKWHVKFEKDSKYQRKGHRSRHSCQTLSFEASAAVNESTDIKNKYILWCVKDFRVNYIPAIFQSSKERQEIARQM